MRRARGRRTGAARDLVDAGPGAPARRGTGCPLILSVGRLHRVKGFPDAARRLGGRPGAARRVQPGDRRRRPRAPDAPRSELVLGDAARRRARSDGLLLLGHRPHRDVLALMAAARAGVPGVVGAGRGLRLRQRQGGVRPRAAGGAWRRGSRCSARCSGGPPTFIDDGVTGVHRRHQHGRRAALRALPRGASRGWTRVAPRWRWPRCASASRSTRWRAGSSSCTRLSTLLISPDYASHYFGLAALGRERLRRGGTWSSPPGPRCASACSPTASSTSSCGSARVTTTASAAQAAIGREREHLRAFFDATRERHGRDGRLPGRRARARHALAARAGDRASCATILARVRAAARRRRPAGLRRHARAAGARAAVRLVPAQPSVPAAASRAIPTASRFASRASSTPPGGRARGAARRCASGRRGRFTEAYNTDARAA